MNAAFKGVDQLRKGREQQRDELKRSIKAASDDVTKAREITAKAEGVLATSMEAFKEFEKEFPAVAGGAPPAPQSQTRVGKKRGPAKKVAAKTAKTVTAKPAAKTAKKLAAKTAKKSAAKVAAKTAKKPGPKKGANKAALKGRDEVSSGKRPPIKHAICRVLGDKQMNAQQIFDEITKKGWLPASNNSRAYIGNILSAKKDVFPPVQRGIYRRADNWESLLGPETRGSKKPAAAKAPAAKAAKNGNGNGHKADTKKDEPAAAAASTETVVKTADAAPAETVKKDILEEAKDIFTPAQA